MFLNCAEGGYDGNDCATVTREPPALPRTCPAWGWSGVPFVWIDVQSLGTSLSSAGSAFLADDTGISVSLPFTFPFYGDSFTSVQVTSNGYLAFGAQGPVSSRNAAIPSNKAPNNMVAAFWDALAAVSEAEGGTSNVFTYAPPGESSAYFAVEWETDLRESTASASDIVQFQTILLPSGGVVFQYLSAGDAGAGATVGAENSDGSDGVQISFEQGDVLSDRSAFALCSPALTGSTAPPPPPNSTFLRSWLLARARASFRSYAQH